MKRKALHLVVARGQQLRLDEHIVALEAMADADDRAMLPNDFARLNARFRFTVDVAAAAHNAKVGHYFSADDDGLTQPWDGERVYCNPPFSNIRPWVEKATQEIRAELIVMVLPADRTEQPWWQVCIEPFRDRAGSRLRVEFLGGRLRFLRAGETSIRLGEHRPAFGCCLCIWRAPA